MYQSTPQSRDMKQRYSAASSIELDFPRSALIPTVEIDGLSVEYELELSLGIAPASSQGSAAVVAETTFRMPVLLTAG